MTVRKRRSGGSKARRAIRQNTEKEAIVFPGLEGGQYKPLSDPDIQKIHKTALDVLENIGIGDPIPEILDHTLDKEKGTRRSPLSTARAAASSAWPFRTTRLPI